MSVFISCPHCGDVGPHTLWDDTRDPLVPWCVNEFCTREFEIPRAEIFDSLLERES